MTESLRIPPPGRTAPGKGNDETNSSNILAIAVNKNSYIFTNNN